jgi:Coenzyme PQQ synthesis protein D (PqqD)
MSYFRVNAPNVIHEIIDGEAVLVNLETGSYYSMAGVAAVVWDCLEKGLEGSQLVEVVTSRYEGEKSVIVSGIQRLLEDLQAEQLIVPAEAAALNADKPAANWAANGPTKPPFEAPVLHKYTDMEDLLLLDPIHDVDETGWPNTNPNNV